MNSINQILSGLCSSLLLSVNMESAAATMARAEWADSSATTAQLGPGCKNCVPTSFAEQ